MRVEALALAEVHGLLRFQVDRHVRHEEEVLTALGIGDAPADNRRRRHPRYQQHVERVDFVEGVEPRVLRWVARVVDVREVRETVIAAGERVVPRGGPVRREPRCRRQVARGDPVLPIVNRQSEIVNRPVLTPCRHLT